VERRTARSAVGQLPSGRIGVVTAEGGGSAYSAGMTNYELAVAMAHLGAVTAIGLGSGTPTGMAFDGSLLTRPTTGTEQSIADALVLSYTGVYASPVAPVFSPNGDGAGDKEALSYRLVRPATVTATLNGPNGTTIQLPGGAQSPGTYPLNWDGKNGDAPAPEGAWTFSVTAKDDRSVTTKAERTFSLDNTLGSLTVARARHGEVAHFVLSRQANVVVRIERPNGTAAATSRLNGLAAGSHAFTWKGRIGAHRAPKGRYLLDVAATSSIGTSSLVAPFSLK